MSRWEGDFCGEFAQGAEIGRQPRRPQAGERGAPAGGAPYRAVGAGGAAGPRLSQSFMIVRPSRPNSR